VHYGFEVVLPIWQKGKQPPFFLFSHETHIFKKRHSPFCCIGSQVLLKAHFASSEVPL